ncbi:alpha/beta hydrolase [Euzebya tangerina]|uniref:alpha/beta hydrolase n=1 Tax=Euzebya tangerina TaxID=591198 RepID=UPI000E31B055|nr:alpha/beta hydrolase [Euzebya tangerina]
MRHDIEFSTEDGVTLRGWRYDAEGASGPAPTIVMAHGFSATKEMYLDDFAEVFAAAGLGVVVYDNRGFGDSEGQPRQHIDPVQQIRDYRDAITWAQSQQQVDADRIGVWGSSYSGGHVLVVSAIDRRVKCVVAQVPLTYGLESARRLVRGDMFAPTRDMFDADRAARMTGEPHAVMPVTAPEGEPCALPTADTYEFFTQLPPDRGKGWKNQVTLQSVELFMEYEPTTYIANISPTPLLLVAARGDHLTPYDLSARAYEAALQPKKLLTLPGGHFDAYVDEAFELSSTVQRDWFVEHLGS